MSTVHVVPLDDLIVHAVPGGYDSHGPGTWLAIEAGSDEPETDCACGTVSEHVPNPDGPDGWLVTHHSLDGRERND